MSSTAIADPETLSADFAHGQPQFDDPDLAALVTAEGAVAAWGAAFARHGLDAPARVKGDFAVAVRTADGRRFMAVDRFAIRTLCHSTTGGRLQVAPSATQIAGDAPPDPQAIFDYLYLHAIASPQTVFRNVHRLPPGHAACFADGRLALAPYWAPRFDDSLGRSVDTLGTRFRELVEQGVRRRIGRHDAARVGCFLSGGTDSSTVAGMFGKVTGQPARTYSIGFDAEGYDEMEYARIAARRFGCSHHEYYVTPDDLVRCIPKVAAHYDQPFGNSSALPAYFCAKMAREDGMDLMLAGDGGDELFGGNSRYALQSVFDFYRHVPGPARELLLEPVLRQPLAQRVRLLRRGAGYVAQAKVPMPDRLQAFNLLKRLGVQEVLSPGLLRQVDTDAQRKSQRAFWDGLQQTTLVNRMLAFDWKYTLAETDLPKVCGTTALAGVAVGFPLLDDDLTDFSMHLPTDFKLRRLKLRWFFKEALRGFLPDEIITKKKHGFGLPFGVWTVRHAGLKALAEDSLATLAERGVVRPDFARSLVRERLAEAPGYYGEMVWILLMMEQWLRAHRPAFRLEG